MILMGLISLLEINCLYNGLLGDEFWKVMWELLRSSTQSVVAIFGEKTRNYMLINFGVKNP
jgi:hypothetical protein